MSKPKKPKPLRIRIHKNRSATLTGVGYSDLKGIFDAAANRMYDLKDERPKDKQTQDYCNGVLKLLEDLRKAMDAGIHEYNVTHQ